MIPRWGWRAGCPSGWRSVASRSRRKPSVSLPAPDGRVDAGIAGREAKARTEDHPRAQEGLSRREDRPRLLEPARAPGRDDPGRPVHRPAREPGDARTLRKVQDGARLGAGRSRSEEHTSELQSHSDLVCRLLLEKKKYKRTNKQGTE